MKKITQLDFQIINLEKMGPKISPLEKCKLDNLREQKCFMKENGIVLKPTMKPFQNVKSRGSRKQQVGHEIAETSKLVSNVKTKPAPLEVDNQVSEKEDEVSKNGTQMEFQVESRLKKNKGKVGVGGSSAFIMFVHYEREQLIMKNPKDKLDLPSVRLAWSKMSESEKTVFQDMAKLQKDKRNEELQSDIQSKTLSATEKKMRKKIADKKYRKRKGEEQSVKKVEDDSLKERLKEIILRKEEELQQMVNVVENLNSDIRNVQKKKQETVEKVVAKDVEILVMKEQYKALHKIHKSCV